VHAVVLCLLFAVGACAAETLDAGPFSVEVAPALMVRFHGMPLITGDRCVGFRGTTAASPVLVDGAQGQIVRAGSILTTVARQGRNVLRREVMVTPEAVHITFELQAFGPTGGSHVEYDLLAPVAALDNVPCVATTGAPRDRRADAQVTLSSQDTKAGTYAQRSVVHGRFAFPAGACSLDLNPQGAWQGESNYGEPTAATLWHDGRLWHFMMLCSGGQFGATMTGKIILRAGDIPYEQVHRRDRVEYTSDFPVALALNFTAGDSDDHFTACPVATVADKPYRWRDPQAVRLVTRDAGGLLYRDYATPSKPSAEGVFEMALPSGLHLLTLYAHDAQAATGPFTVSGPEGVLCRDVRVPRGEYWVKTVPLRSRDGRTRVTFRGDWKVNGLRLQEILGEAEDFLFDRPYWNASLPVAP
jgi:hypothetical protein